MEHIKVPAKDPLAEEVKKASAADEERASHASPFVWVCDELAIMTGKPKYAKIVQQHNMLKAAQLNRQTLLMYNVMQQIVRTQKATKAQVDRFLASISTPDRLRAAASVIPELQLGKEIEYDPSNPLITYILEKTKDKRPIQPSYPPLFKSLPVTAENKEDEPKGVSSAAIVAQDAKLRDEDTSINEPKASLAKASHAEMKSTDQDSDVHLSSKGSEEAPNKKYDRITQTVDLDVDAPQPLSAKTIAESLQALAITDEHDAQDSSAQKKETGTPSIDEPVAGGSSLVETREDDPVKLADSGEVYDVGIGSQDPGTHSDKTQGASKGVGHGQFEEGKSSAGSNTGMELIRPSQIEGLGDKEKEEHQEAIVAHTKTETGDVFAALARHAVDKFKREG